MPLDPDVVASPCVSLCRMDPGAGSIDERDAGGLCIGCRRTLDEIVEWGGASVARKRDILAAVQRRRI